MRMPKNLPYNKIEENKEIKVTDIEIDLSEPHEYAYNFKPDETKDHKKYIKRLERLIRNSLEYRNYIRYIKEEYDLTKCALFKNLDATKLRKTKLNFHHYPFNLFEITDTVYKSLSNFGMNIVDDMDVVERVVELHYENKIGLVPLCVTGHELSHSGSIFIHLDLVFGNVNSFIESYYDFIDLSLIDSLNVLKDLSNSEASVDINKYIFEKNFRNIIIEGREFRQVELNNETKTA